MKTTVSRARAFKLSLARLCSFNKRKIFPTATTAKFGPQMVPLRDRWNTLGGAQREKRNPRECPDCAHGEPQKIFMKPRKHFSTRRGIHTHQNPSKETKRIVFPRKLSPTRTRLAFSWDPWTRRCDRKTKRLWHHRPSRGTPPGPWKPGTGSGWSQPLPWPPETRLPIARRGSCDNTKSTRDIKLTCWYRHTLIHKHTNMENWRHETIKKYTLLYHNMIGGTNENNVNSKQLWKVHKAIENKAKRSWGDRTGDKVFPSLSAGNPSG